ncbi:type IV secretion system protein VirB3 (plasmid) [Lichenicola cladoniae]|uniref:Type IV secretion system protein VirB3 n=1 Tax=Lichenicola cladoniae TaxID=1484109 RepID=A0A6M8HZF0_9PROT|nr:type IV secretion system protein VirB3 [Acetobacteraceae bacterium]QKE93772.1 type IV secretion system protein VirB3 [Lichenicola cladoniae]
MAQRGITVDTLFLACTRPAMWQGVPIEAACLNAMGTVIFFIIMKNPCYMLIGVVLHYVIRTLISRDYNVFGVFRLWVDTKGLARNASRWGGSSVSPLPLRRARSAREVRIHV